MKDFNAQSKNGFTGLMSYVEGLPKSLTGHMEKAFNEAKKAMKEAAIEETRSRYFISVSHLRSEMVIRSTQDGVMLVVRGKRNPISEFRLIPKKPRKGKYALKAGVRRDSGLKTITPMNGNKPFLMPTFYRRKNIAMVRLGRERTPLVPIWAPSSAQLVRWSELYEHGMEGQTEAQLTKAFTDWARRNDKQGVMTQDTVNIY